MSTRAQSGQWPRPWLPTGASASPLQPPPGQETGLQRQDEPRGRDLLLKEGKHLHWCPWRLEPSAPLPRADGAARQAGPVGSHWAQAGTPLLWHRRAGHLQGARLEGPGSSSRWDTVALPAAGMLSPPAQGCSPPPCTPTLCCPRSPARRGAGNIGKVFEKKVTAP